MKCSLKDARSLWNGLALSERDKFFFIVQEKRSDLDDTDPNGLRVTNSEDFIGTRFENFDSLTQKAIAESFNDVGFCS